MAHGGVGGGGVTQEAPAGFFFLESSRDSVNSLELHEKSRVAQVLVAHMAPDI
jgi:hypothetical protein